MPSEALPVPFPPPFDGDDASELAWLLRAERAGLPVTPMAVVPVTVEATFYQLNNLPEQLLRLFAGVVSDDPDEDDLEERAPEAIALVLGHTLLDEVIEGLYDALDGLPERLLVRRAGSDGVATWRGRETLLTIKRTWSRAWQVDAIAARLRAGQGLAPQPQPLLVHDAAVARANETLDLGPDGAAVEAWHDGAGRLARLALRPH